MTQASKPCPCGSGAAYEACCGPLHAGEAAADAAQLMRSRYSAYVLGVEDYLLATWHPTTRPRHLELDAPPKPKWIGLEVKAYVPRDDAHATVEFVARYKINGRACRLHEVSNFERVDGRWLYVDGEMRD